MNRVPKPPIGFVPVDSEEARKIDNGAMVNYAYTADGVWMCGNSWMRTVRGMVHSGGNYHVQLPPPVEWEEVWGWGRDPNTTFITKNGEPFLRFGFSTWTDAELGTIVRALNEMEGRDG